MTERWPAVEELVPHRGPARLITRILEVDERGILCEGRVPHDSPFLRSGGAPSHVALEMAAQAAAALEALGRWGGGEPPSPQVGYLVAVRGATLSSDLIPADEPLVVRATPTGGVASLAIYEIVVRRGQDTVATGTLSTFLVAPAAETP